MKYIHTYVDTTTDFLINKNTFVRTVVYTIIIYNIIHMIMHETLVTFLFDIS